MHEIQILVGPGRSLEPVSQEIGAVSPQRLTETLLVVPVCSTAVAIALGVPEFLWPDLENPMDPKGIREHLAPFARLVARLRPAGAIALILTQYWGGSGSQVAMGFLNGEPVLGPLVGPGSVNAALRSLGVVAQPGCDEWDVVGLSRWRTMEAFDESFAAMIERYERHGADQRKIAPSLARTNPALSPSVVEYVWKYYLHLIPDVEKLAYKSLLLKKKADNTASGVAEALSSRMQELSSSEVTAALASGPDAFLERVAERVLREHPQEVFLNRCPRCDALCRSPRAKQCPECHHTWRAASTPGTP